MRLDASAPPQRERGALLEVRDLSVVFNSRRGSLPLRAVDGVSIAVDVNETVGLVGESGSGKTTIARTVLGMERATAGSIRFFGEDITHVSRDRRRALSKELQVVFQDPYGSLSPTRTIEKTLIEPLTAHHLCSRREATERVAEMLTRVGLPADAMRRYPSEFSGGQRQRIAIARALMPSPRLVVCDEPVSALDLSIQAQVLNLLRGLQRELGVSYLFIAHNMSVVRYMAARVVVLYRGRVMEVGDAQAIYQTPAHPYTRSLLDAAPVADPSEQRYRRVVATPAAPQTQQTRVGCLFAPRCPYAIEACVAGPSPPLVPGPAGTLAACLRIAEIPPYRMANERKPTPEALSSRSAMGT